MNEINFFFIRSCRTLQKETGVPGLSIPITKLTGLQANKVKNENISRKKSWAVLTIRCCHPIRKQERYTIRKNGQATKLCWMFILISSLPGSFSFQKI